MKANFEYSEEDIREIILEHHKSTWGTSYPNYTGHPGIWVARSDYRGVNVSLEEKWTEDVKEEGK